LRPTVLGTGIDAGVNKRRLSWHFSTRTHPGCPTPGGVKGKRVLEVELFFHSVDYWGGLNKRLK
jgi:hypothetical protein